MTLVWPWPSNDLKLNLEYRLINWNHTLFKIKWIGEDSQGQLNQPAVMRHSFQLWCSITHTKSKIRRINSEIWALHTGRRHRIFSPMRLRIHFQERVKANLMAWTTEIEQAIPKWKKEIITWRTEGLLLHSDTFYLKNCVFTEIDECFQFFFVSLFCYNAM